MIGNDLPHVLCRLVIRGNIKQRRGCPWVAKQPIATGDVPEMHHVLDARDMRRPVPVPPVVAPALSGLGVEIDELHVLGMDQAEPRGAPAPATAFQHPQRIAVEEVVDGRERAESMPRHRHARRLQERLQLVVLDLISPLPRRRVGDLERHRRDEIGDQPDTCLHHRVPFPPEDANVPPCLLVDRRRLATDDGPALGGEPPEHTHARGEPRDDPLHDAHRQMRPTTEAVELAWRTFLIRHGYVTPASTAITTASVLATSSENTTLMSPATLQWSRRVGCVERSTSPPE